MWEEFPQTSEKFWLNCIFSILWWDFVSLTSLDNLLWNYLQNKKKQKQKNNANLSPHEPPHDKTNKVACAPSEDSDQPTQSDQSSLSAWRNIGSLATHWAHNKDSDQTDLSLRWAHMPFCWFCHEAAQMICLLWQTEAENFVLVETGFAELLWGEV